jgi:hypothetical protein
MGWGQATRWDDGWSTTALTALKRRVPRLPQRSPSKHPCCFPPSLVPPLPSFQTAPARLPRSGACRLLMRPRCRSSRHARCCLPHLGLVARICCCCFRRCHWRGALLEGWAPAVPCTCLTAKQQTGIQAKRASAELGWGGGKTEDHIAQNTISASSTCTTGFTLLPPASSARSLPRPPARKQALTRFCWQRRHQHHCCFAAAPASFQHAPDARGRSGTCPHKRSGRPSSICRPTAQGGRGAWWSTEEGRGRAVGWGWGDGRTERKLRSIDDAQ